jgi:hypothetical protein
MNRVLLILVISVLSGSLRAQESPTTPRSARVWIIQGPQIDLASEHLTIIRWTTNNPGGSPVHYGIVHYGTAPTDISAEVQATRSVFLAAAAGIALSRSVVTGSGKAVNENFQFALRI